MSLEAALDQPLRRSEEGRAMTVTQGRLAAADAIQAALFGPFVDSTNRLEKMLELVAGQPAGVFWPVFLDAWPNCDATWGCRHDLLIYLRRHHPEAPGPSYLQGGDRDFFGRLPEQIEVFRGCSRPRLRGISWTTDYDVAAGFARGHRGTPVPVLVIARATIPKAAVFGAFAKRNEGELVVDPRRLRKLTIRSVAPSGEQGQ